MYHMKTIDETFTELEASHAGLSEEEAKRRLEIYGPNSLEKGKRLNVVKVFIHQFTDPLIYILIIAAIVTAFLQDWVDTGVILVVITLNAVIASGRRSRPSRRSRPDKPGGAEGGRHP